MKKTIILLLATAAAIAGIVLIQGSPSVSVFLWNISDGGVWLLPLVLVASLLDSVHPCSFSILLITIAFLFGASMTRKKILQVGGTYVAGIFAAYLLIGLGLLQTLHLFGVPHFMGKLGAGLLITFGVINLLNALFPNFPIKLKIPSVSHTAMGKLIDKASIPAALFLGILVGICQFPCMGGPYLMVIGLLYDQVTYRTGVLYLLLYNLILIVPLVVVLLIAADKTVVGKIEEWKRASLQNVRLWAGVSMVIIGVLIFFL